MIKSLLLSSNLDYMTKLNLIPSCSSCLIAMGHGKNCTTCFNIHRNRLRRKDKYDKYDKAMLGRNPFCAEMMLWNIALAMEEDKNYITIKKEWRR